MRYCTNCGTQLADQVMICPHCGTMESYIPSQQTPPSMHEQQPQYGYPPQQGTPNQYGYPPQQGYCPPQQGYYPPQQSYYPPQPYPYQPPRQASSLATVAKVFMMLGTITSGFAIFPLLWCVPMTISYFHKVKNNLPVSIGFKICTLLFVNTISGILMLCDTNQ